MLFCLNFQDNAGKRSSLFFLMEGKNKDHKEALCLCNGSYVATRDLL